MRGTAELPRSLSCSPCFWKNMMSTRRSHHGNCKLHIWMFFVLLCFIFDARPAKMMLLDLCSWPTFCLASVPALLSAAAVLSQHTAINCFVNCSVCRWAVNVNSSEGGVAFQCSFLWLHSFSCSSALQTWWTIGTKLFEVNRKRGKSNGKIIRLTLESPWGQIPMLSPTQGAGRIKCSSTESKEDVKAHLVLMNDLPLMKCREGVKVIVCLIDYPEVINHL